jgi:D-3-phosphoglycerate dehydrogenase
VFATEPPRPGQPLLAHDRVVVSPRCAGLTSEAAVRMAVESAANALALLDGRIDPAVLVNPQVLAERVRG